MDGMPGKLHVAGRRVTDPRVEIIAEENTVSVRVDSSADPEFWFTLTMDSDRLIDFLGRIAVMHPTQSTALCAMLENVSIAFKM